MQETRNKSRERGFTIIESLVAITILVLIVIGSSTAVQTGISSYIFSKDQIVAFYLAQEGTEQIRNMRDNNGLADVNWLTGISSGPSDPCYFGSSCTVDATTNVVTQCPSGPSSCPVLRQDPESGLYGYDAAWESTNFRRAITLTSISADEVSIDVQVTWSKGDTEREFTAKENILNWQ